MTFVSREGLAREKRQQLAQIVKDRDLDVDIDFMNGLINAQHYSAWLCPKASPLVSEMILQEATRKKQ
jgi:hypothetical protein